MTHYSVGDGGQPIFMVNEYGPGVVVATWGERGVPAHIVAEGGGYAQAVFFENGPPPGYGLLPGAIPPPPDMTPQYFLLLQQ
jgi:hypothetical protein